MNRRARCLGLAFMLLVLPALSGGLADTAPNNIKPGLEKKEAPAPRINIFPVSESGDVVLLQGQAFLVRIDDPGQSTASIRAKWGSQTIPCLPYPDRSKWYGLGGVDKRAIPGSYILDVTIETTRGKRISARTKFSVEKRKFARDKLTVAPDMARVPASIQSRVDDERKAFREIWDNPSYGRYWQGPFLRPLPGRITATYGDLRVFNGAVKSTHGGVDFAGPTGAPVKAAAAGIVALVRSCHIEGDTVVIDHGSGVFTYYCHLSEFKAQVGDVVDQGDVIGLVGATGRVTGPHLHWGCRVQGVRVDALTLLELSPWLSGKSNLIRGE